MTRKTRQSEQLPRLVPWIIALLGLIVMLLDYINTALVNSWIEGHGLVDQTPAVLEWLLAFVGLTLVVLGAYLIQSKQRQTFSDRGLK